MTKDKIKRLKVYSKFRRRRYDNTTVPEIRLIGKWLEKLGFKEGSEIVIQQEQNKLTIMLVQ